MRSENFHAQCATRHDKAAFQRRAENAGEGGIKREIIEKFKADANKSAFSIVNFEGDSKCACVLRNAFRRQSCLQAAIKEAISMQVDNPNSEIVA